METQFRVVMTVMFALNALL